MVGDLGGWKASYIPYSTNDPKEALKVLKGAGYEGVEWVRFLHFMDLADLKNLAAMTKESGLEVSNLMIGHDFVTPDDKQRQERVQMVVDSIEAAAEAGFSKVNMTTGPGEWQGALTLGKDISEGKAWDAVVDSFGKVAGVAEKKGVTITLEAAFNMVVRDYYTLTDFLHEVGSKNLAVNMDPSHLALVGNDVPWVVRKLGSLIKGTHVKDVFGKPGTNKETFNFPLLGSGVIDWKAFFTALREIGYGGFLTVEFEADPYLQSVWGNDWSKAAQTSMEELRALVGSAGGT